MGLQPGGCFAAKADILGIIANSVLNSCRIELRFVAHLASAMDRTVGQAPHRLGRYFLAGAVFVFTFAWGWASLTLFGIS